MVEQKTEGDDRTVVFIFRFYKTENFIADFFARVARDCADIKLGPRVFGIGPYLSLAPYCENVARIGGGGCKGRLKQRFGRVCSFGTGELPGVDRDAVGAHCEVGPVVGVVDLDCGGPEIGRRTCRVGRRIFEFPEAVGEGRVVNVVAAAADIFGLDGWDKGCDGQN
jgi:hypothetical protein